MKAPDHRVLQLLVDRATEGLNEAGAARLAGLLAAKPDLDTQSFDVAAAMIDVALAPPTHAPLPERLREKILATALGTRHPPTEPQKPR